jgi:hypothetical protein
MQLKGKTVTFLDGVHEGLPPENCPFCDAPRSKKDRKNEQHYTCGLKLETQLTRHGPDFYQLLEPLEDDGTADWRVGDVGPDHYGCRKAHKKTSKKRNKVVVG